MNRTDVTTDGLKHVRPGREAVTGARPGPGGESQPKTARRAERRRGGERPMVPEAEFTSYYGQPVINQPVWESPDIPGYLFLGGLAGASSVTALAAQLTRRPGLARIAKLGGALAGALSVVALTHDLGRPSRFANMLRTFKVTSPMSVGSWLLGAYLPAAALAAGSEMTGIAPGIGGLATVSAAVIGPALSTYTAALISDTAVPAWHDAFRQMPFLFAASAVTSAAGLGLIGAPIEECGPVRLLGAVAGSAELAADRWMQARMGLASECFEEGKPKRFHLLATSLLGVGVLGSLFAKKSRLVSALAGLALLSGSALTRFAVFEAGLASAHDPKFTVVPQRRRLEQRAGERSGRGPTTN